MTNYKSIPIKDYTYNLPDERIAKYPLHERDASKLLVFKNNQIFENKFKNLSNFLDNTSLIVFNNTKVIQARLNFKKPTGAKIEIFCLEPQIPADYEQSFQSKNRVQWKCIVGNAKKWKEGFVFTKVTIKNTSIPLKAKKIKQDREAWIIEFTWENDFSFSEIIENTGQTPIPPYLNRKAENSDKTRYQTVYSKYKGSVAAPTAGLHFTNSTFNDIKNNNIQTAEVSLHVGAGTFKPVKSETIEGHEMHSEHFIVEKQVIEKLIGNLGKITAVGTTAVRTLESLYWIGIKLITGNYSSVELTKISQWEAYQLNNEISPETSLNALLNYLNQQNTDFIEADTQIIIVPGYQFKIVNSLVTNFHQPKSTLLLLISAFVGEKWKEIYEFALANDFRFLSYGDSSLLIPKNKE